MRVRDASQCVYEVDANKLSCTCGWPKTGGTPCPHVYACERESQGEIDAGAFLRLGLSATDLVHVFSKSASLPAFNFTELVADNLRPPAPPTAQTAVVDSATGDVRVIQEPVSKKGLQKRKKSKGEIESARKERAASKCSRCHQPGHNRRSCPQLQFD